MRLPIPYPLVIFLCLLPLDPVWAGCGFRPGLETLEVAAVIDGDTLVRDDGERLRLVALNTPELAREDTPAQPLAARAREYAGDFVDRAERLYWRAAPGGTDRYGRHLGEVYNQAGESLSARLLRQGLGFYIAVAPLPDWWTCLRAVEDGARERRVGVWRHPHFRALPASEAIPADAGFQRIRGRVMSLERAGHLLWAELDGPVVLRLSGTAFGARAAGLRGREVEVSGWLVDRSGSSAHRRGHKPLVMQVDHPSAIRLEPLK